MAVEVMGLRAIRRIRETLGLPRRVVAARADVTEVFLGDLERGQRKDLKVSTLKKVVRALAVLSGRPEKEIALEVLYGDEEAQDTNAPASGGR